MGNFCVRVCVRLRDEVRGRFLTPSMYSYSCRLWRLLVSGSLLPTVRRWLADDVMDNHHIAVVRGADLPSIVFTKLQHAMLR